jgi:hypothetical protein
MYLVRYTPEMSMEKCYPSKSSDLATRSKIVQYWLDSRQKQEIFLFSKSSDRTWGPQPPIQWFPGSSSMGKKAAVGVKLTTKHLVPSLKMRALYLHFFLCLHTKALNCT